MRTGPPRRRLRRASRVLALLALLALGPLDPAIGRADDHEPREGAHPVRIAAYVLHPIGVILDWVLVRPAHWLVEREPFRTLFGHEE
jgi:hypothetical protein